MTISAVKVGAASGPGAEDLRLTETGGLAVDVGDVVVVGTWHVHTLRVALDIR